jgi:carboxypeptidase family protein
MAEIRVFYDREGKTLTVWFAERSREYRTFSLRPWIVCGASAILALIGVANAQSPGISGRVLDAAGLPLPGVSITILPASGGTTSLATTASTGAYRSDALGQDTYRVDFDVAGFDLIRRNNVRVRRGTTAEVDAVLSVSSICECVEVVPANPLRERAGQVVEESGAPLPYARLEVVSSPRCEVAYADRAGRFLVRLPVDGTWPLTASDSGFGSATLKVSGTTADPIVFRLKHDAKAATPDHERLSRGCRCPGDLFTHQGR